MVHEDAAILVAAAIGRRLDGDEVAQAIRGWFEDHREKIESEGAGPSGSAAVNDLESRVASWTLTNVPPASKFTLDHFAACVEDLTALGTWLCSDD